MSIVLDVCLVWPDGVLSTFNMFIFKKEGKKGEEV